MGVSYYSFWVFLNSLLIFNLAINLIRPRLFVGLLVGFATLYALVSLGYRFFLPGLFPDFFTDNVFVKLAGHSYIGDFLIFAVPVVLTKIKKSPWYWLLLIIIILAIAVSNSRSAEISLIFGLIFLPFSGKLSRFAQIVAVITLTLALGYTFFFANNLKSPSGSRPEYWLEAVNGFLSAPFTGTGPGTFILSSSRFRPSPERLSTYADNSFLEFLSGNGLFFTAVFFALVFYGLKYQFRRDRLFFVLGIIALCHSLADPTWSSPGILIISLIFLFYGLNGREKSLLAPLLATAVFFFGTTQFLSRYYLDRGFLQVSLKLDPFNSTALTALLPQSSDRFYRLYGDHPVYLHQLTEYSYLPQNEAYFYKLFVADPWGSTNQYIRLAYYYSVNSRWDKLPKLVDLAKNKVNPDLLPLNQTLILAKAVYRLSLYEWGQGNHRLAIGHLQTAARFAQGWSHFEIELANAYWHNGQKDLAVKLLETDCPQQHPLSAAHCRQYLSEHRDNFPEPGSFAAAIATLYAPPAD